MKGGEFRWRGVAVCGLGLVWCGLGWGCGEATGSLAPEVGLVDVMCAPSVSDEIEGEIVSRIEARVSDADGDLARVTVTVQGSVLGMEEEAEGVYIYTPSTAGDNFILCEAGLRVLVRAIDDAGNVGQQEVTVR